jgi:hypothetical protein
MSSNLWKKDNFINENIIYLFNKDIVEYDMKSAGLSLIQEFKLLPDSDIQKLKEVGKHQREIKIGKMQIKNEKLKNGLKDAFQAARQMFFELNKLENSDIISIKKDAIFTTKYCEYTKIGKYIDFRPKHNYSSYIRLDKRLEFYYSPSELSVKGIDDELLKYHQDYLLKFINLYFKKMETSDSPAVIEFTRNFIDKYKARELSLGYYRNFNIKSDFVIYNDDNRYMNYWEEDKDQVDISYNYFNILLKLIKIPL